ncbi:MAG: sulfate ABC transporter permease subunit CysT [Alphaproteobacteria bacterium]|nr:sulfate ABC transporter permease subunit CysT [Alphaproteobacteria bacterium]MBU1515914.1 sulfate ABC transporter permease subunit CysT [Alphaproteobacteria bacterium]MBU2094136.1 sulfate ABC transporter permease subunit CysT [Alphaproteobacteria bacterium]MBU2151488.1 sulfate ABC transporter permease subunit CysT [Alphaproteobacteria bacterium]MBU2305236.1 sulfate ABC transporter permease subunit CysT [Alphaproteobacteria bacterium]
MTAAALAPLAGKPRSRWKQPSILPGFPLAMGWTLTYLGLVVVLPLIALVVRPWELGLSVTWSTLTEPRVLAALRLSFGSAFLAALTNVPIGLLVAWTLTRYEFPGRRLIDAFVDLPFALPTAVAGIALTAIYGPNGPLGELFAKIGIKTAYSPVGIYIALLFIGLPFVVRTIQPVLQDLDREVEEAAHTLGATNLQRFWLVVLPAVLPALLSGFSLAFARAVGEYGSVIFIAGNMPMKSEIAPLLIVIKLEQYDYAGAASVGLAMLAISFGGLLAMNGVQLFLARRGRV